MEEKSRELPAAPDVERSILGMMLLRELAYHEIASSGLTVDYFLFDSNRRIYRAIQRLVEGKRTPDVVTVCDELERQKELEAVGGAAYLGSLLDGVPDSGGNISEYVDILREKYLRRQTIHIANKMLAAADDLSDPIKWTISGTHDDLLRLQGEVSHEGYAIADFDDEVLGVVKEQMYCEREIIGLPFGIRELDEVTTGIREGEFVPVGGYSGCVAPETMIEGVPIAERKCEVLSTLFGPALPSNPYLKGREDLYEVQTRSGSRVVVTLDHRFLSPTGWSRLRHLCVGSLIAADGSENDSFGLGRRSGFPGCYLSDLRRCGELLHPVQVELLNKWRQLRRIVYGNISSVPHAHLSTADSCCLLEPYGWDPSQLPSPASVYGFAYEGWLCSASSGDTRPPTERSFLPPNSGERFHPSVNYINASCWRRDTEPRHASRVNPLPFLGVRENGVPFFLCGDFLSRNQQPPVRRGSDSEFGHQAFWDEITSIKFIRHGEYYDIFVPTYNHYSAHGLWHHNSAKTAFACNVARVNAMSGIASGFFSIEMKKDQLLHRFWAQASDISYSTLRNPKNLHRQEFRELQERWMPEVRKWPIKIDDVAKDIKDIIPRAHLWVRRHGVKLIIVDYLQRVHAPGKGEYEQVSYAADALTEFAKETKVPVLCLSQLTRPDGKQKNAANIPPTMGQLRSSGRIEQNAHLVLFTHRPEDDSGQPTGEDLIIIGKQRAGVKGRIKAYFHGLSQRWEERGPEPEKPKQETMFKKNGKAADVAATYPA
jgi:replicative DNA helicase